MWVYVVLLFGHRVGSSRISMTMNSEEIERIGENIPFRDITPCCSLTKVLSSLFNSYVTFVLLSQEKNYFISFLKNCVWLFRAAVSMTSCSNDSRDGGCKCRPGAKRRLAFKFVCLRKNVRKKISSSTRLVVCVRFRWTNQTIGLSRWPHTAAEQRRVRVTVTIMTGWLFWLFRHQLPVPVGTSFGPWPPSRNVCSFFSLVFCFDSW